jgi:hypothetical protein
MMLIIENMLSLKENFLFRATIWRVSLLCAYDFLFLISF